MSTSNASPPDDLGDILNAKVGDRISVIWNDKGGLQVGPTKYTVTRRVEDQGLVRFGVDGCGRSSGYFLLKDGGRHGPMPLCQKDDLPWLSVNPKHFEMSDERARKNAEAEAAKKADEERRLAQFKAAVESLCAEHGGCIYATADYDGGNARVNLSVGDASCVLDE